MSLTKSIIYERVENNLNMTPSKAKKTVEELLEIMKSSLASRQDVMISGFGKFQVKEKAARKGRNPATGKDLILDKRRVVTFKCAGTLRDRINE